MTIHAIPIFKYSALHFFIVGIIVLFFAHNIYAQAQDTTPPDDVENVVAVPGDGKVTLSWDATTDNVGVTNYKIYYGTETVDENGEQYNLGFIEAGNVTTYAVTNLDNETTYYFAITGADTAGNESTNYSYEVQATPAGEVSRDDTTAPRVTIAESLGPTSARIQFSEEIVLPETTAENAFLIEDSTTGTSLPVISARLDADEPDTAILTTEPQEQDREYIVTVGIGITDKADNPIVSGISDTALFKGKADADQQELPAEQADTTPPQIISAVPVSPERLKIAFSEEVVLGEKPQENFLLYEKGSPDDTIDIITASLDPNDTSLVILDTETMVGARIYVAEIVDVSDEAGNSLIVDDQTNVVDFEALTQTIVDIISPEDVTNFMARLEEMVVRLTWVASLNSARDLVDQMLYISTDKGKTYDRGKSLGKATTSYEVKDLKKGQEYTFKLTVKDTSGNESTGVITSLFLPETGPGLLGILALGSLGIGMIVSRLRKK